MNETLAKLIHKYECAGPRYTSYPTAPFFTTSADKEALHNLALEDPAECSLYVHIPFCASLCWFCACTSSVCTDPFKADEYLELLDAELELWQKKGLGKRPLRQIHLGGGTPNFLSRQQIARLNAIIEKHFKKAADCEFSAELDPRTLTLEKVRAFAEAGVNRASLGVQDTNHDTQRAIHRVQPQSDNMRAADWLRSCGISKINVDLVYGLPLQNLKTFETTLKDALSLAPDRCAIFNYAHVPWMKAAQKNLEKYPLPDAEEKVALFLSALDAFAAAGFEYIGLDHFAKPDDALIEARKNGTLQRNFQGYSTRAGLNGISIGLTSISATHTSYRQNFKDMDAYRASIKGGELPTERGLILTDEDLLRRKIIMDIMCALKVRYADYACDFGHKFAAAFKPLLEMQNDGLVSLDAHGFVITQTGRLFLRNAAMLFDARLRDGEARYSKTV